MTENGVKTDIIEEKKPLETHNVEVPKEVSVPKEEKHSKKDKKSKK